MRQRNIVPFVFAAGMLSGVLVMQLGASEDAKPVLETLLKAELESAEGLEVVVSRVTIPPHQGLPKHYHPGEEFVYVLEGETTVHRADDEDRLLGPGDVYKVPFEAVHSASTAERSATALVFRVHRRGEPERIPVD